MKFDIQEALKAYLAPATQATPITVVQGATWAGVLVSDWVLYATFTFYIVSTILVVLTKGPEAWEKFRERRKARK